MYMYHVSCPGTSDPKAPPQAMPPRFARGARGERERNDSSRVHTAV